MGLWWGVLFNVIPYLQHGMFYECNLLRRLGPYGTGMGARFNVIPYLRHGHAISMQFATQVWFPWDRGVGMLFNAIPYLRHGYVL